jgi:tripartite-type tricarboxylate transporter receptor subunit TctC
MAVGAARSAIHCREPPGAGSNIATEAVVRASGDGYTLLLITSTNAIKTTLYDKLSFDLIRDIAPVASVNRSPGVMEVNPMVPAKSVLEFIAYAKANPGKISMASAGPGSAGHISGELFKTMTGVDLVQVHYRGSGPAFPLGQDRAHRDPPNMHLDLRQR